MKVMIDKGAVIPKRAHSTDAGLDLCSMEDRIIYPRQYKSIGADGRMEPMPIGETFDTGVHILFDPGTYGKIESKSGLNVNHGIVSCGGVIDEGYTGSIKVKLYNLGTEPYTVHKGDKIAQLIVQPYLTPKMEWVMEFEETERGDSGFGSTGV